MSPNNIQNNVINHMFFSVKGGDHQCSHQSDLEANNQSVKAVSVSKYIKRNWLRPVPFYMKGDLRMKSFEEMLDAYAELAVQTGVNLQEGQTLIIQSSITAADFVHRAMRAAYRRGARYVHVDWLDERGTRIWYEMAPEEGLREFPDWTIKGCEEMIDDGAAVLYLLAPFLDDVKGIDPHRLDLASDAAANKADGLTERLMNMEVNWTVMAVATAPWADKVFPNVEAANRMEKLWEMIFQLVHLDKVDPVLAWEQKVKQLSQKASLLTDQAFRFLHYQGPGTDLKVELPSSHQWVSSLAQSKRGVSFIGNLPTEEVYTTPLKKGVNGTVRGTKPFVFEGKKIADFSFEFKEGKVVSVSSSDGEMELQKMIGFDEGACYAGEVALVPDDSPVSKSGRLFYQPLFDENASCHLALGHAYTTGLKEGASVTAEDRSTAGINSSFVHFDFMVGSADLSIYGEKQDGTIVPIFEKGNWTGIFKGSEQK